MAAIYRRAHLLQFSFETLEGEDKKNIDHYNKNEVNQPNMTVFVIFYCISAY